LLQQGKLSSGKGHALSKVGFSFEQHLPLLIEGLEDDSDMLRTASAEALKDMGEKAMPAYTDLVRAVDRGGNPSIYASEALGNLGSAGASPSTAVPALIRLLSSRLKQTSTSRTAVSVIEALEKFGSAAEPALPVLREAEGSKNAHISSAASTAVRNILVDIEQDYLTGDTNVEATSD